MHTIHRMHYRVKHGMTMEWVYTGNTQREHETRRVPAWELRIEIWDKRRERGRKRESQMKEGWEGRERAPDRRKVAFIDGKDSLKNVGRYLGSRDPNDSDGKSNVTQFLRKRGEGDKGIGFIVLESPRFWVQLSTPFAVSHSVNFPQEWRTREVRTILIPPLSTYFAHPILCGCLCTLYGIYTEFTWIP